MAIYITKERQLREAMEKELVKKDKQLHELLQKQQEVKSRSFIYSIAVMPKKINCVFLLTLSTLIFGPNPKLFFDISSPFIHKLIDHNLHYFT